ncbi:MAG: hypothetical protein KFF72_14135 [Arthrospira sp. SH-MAG29]|nr:hypothetical protein [Arthrospira sp. SH-MAG29]MBS0017465.1 hypothetical protein [Arthrospira sp. SH-MAG29]
MGNLSFNKIIAPHHPLKQPTQPPTPELIAFCEKLTGVIAIASLTNEPLEAPLTRVPPNLNQRGF